MTPRNTGVPSDWQGTPRRTWRPESRRPRYPRANEFPQYPHNQERHIMSWIKDLFTRKNPPGPTYDPDAAIIGLHDDHEIATAEDAEAGRQARLNAALDDLQAQSEGRATTHGQWERPETTTRNGVVSAKRQAPFERTVRGNTRDELGLLTYGETRRKERLRNAKLARGYSDDSKAAAAYHDPEREADYEAHERLLRSLEDGTYKGIGEYDDPSTSPYTDPTK